MDISRAGEGEGRNFMQVRLLSGRASGLGAVCFAVVELRGEQSWS